MERLTFKERLHNGQTIFLTMLIIIASAVLLTRSEALFGEFGIYILTISLIYAICGLSVNLITGYCGQLSLGQAGFFAIGAYSAGIFSLWLSSLNLPSFAVIILSITVAAVVAGVFGYIIGLPTLRLSGDYLAIVTLGFAEIIRISIRNFPQYTGGGAGLTVEKFTVDPHNETFISFMWVFIVFIIVVFAVMMFVKSGSGRRTVAVREDEIAANAMGVNVKSSKQTAFVFAAVIAGIGGSLFSFTQGYVSPLTFQFQLSVDFLIIAVFGGLGSFTGAIIAGVALTSINQGILPSLKALAPTFQEKIGSAGFFDFIFQGLAWFFDHITDLRLPIYALILIVVMVYRPKGLLGTKEWSLTNFWNTLFGIKKETLSENGGAKA